MFEFANLIVSTENQVGFLYLSLWEEPCGYCTKLSWSAMLLLSGTIYLDLPYIFLTICGIFF